MIVGGPHKQYPRSRRLLTGLFGLVCLITMFSFACLLAPAEGRTPTRLFNDTGGDWSRASLTEAGVKVAPIAELVGAIKCGDYKNIHSVLLARGGRLILEEYFQGYDRDKPHQIRSAVKSIGSVLVGIAIDRGYLSGVDEPICHYFKDQTVSWDDRGREVTIKSLLTMTSGFECDDHRGESFQCERAMKQAEDWVDFALNLPMAHQPGEYWAYNSTSLILLSEIIMQVTCRSVPVFAEKYLMQPLGITGFRWGFSPKGRAWLGGSASMRPRDMVRFGQMCLNKGVWEKGRIVSDKWMAESTRLHAYSEYGMEYGYLWWRGHQMINGQRLEAFWAQGNGGQVIFICPTVELVAVFTGDNYNSILELQFMGMLINYILPAMLPPRPRKTFISPDKEAIAALAGHYQCNQLHLDLFRDGDALVGQLAGQKLDILFEANDRIFVYSPIFGDMRGKMLRDTDGNPTRLLLNTAFSNLRFNKSG
jgi:CubicO group peptidase (beta-lactamase class C family)